MTTILPLSAETKSTGSLVAKYLSWVSRCCVKKYRYTPRRASCSVPAIICDGVILLGLTDRHGTESRDDEKTSERFCKSLVVERSLKVSVKQGIVSIQGF
jgi:hypothetical protein